MLTRITVIGLFNETNYDIPLKDGCLTFIHAQNGCGKTTVMKLVSNTLRGNFEDIRTVPFQRMDLYFDNNTKIIVENRNQELTVLVSKNQLEEEISPEDLGEFMKVTYIDPERAYTIDESGNIVPSVMNYMNELAKNIGKAMAGGELELTEIPDCGLTEADLDQTFKNIEAKLNFIKRAGFQPAIPAKYRFPPSRYEIGERKGAYAGLARSLKAYADRYYPFAESIVTYKDIVNTLYVNKSIDINDRGFVEARMDASGTVVPISKFSSGEKQILIMFYLLLFKAAPGSLVIIDEPEVSLHVSWQQQIGKFITDIAKVRNLQVLVSTHAPAVIHDCWDLAVELKRSA